MSRRVLLVTVSVLSAMSLVAGLLTALGAFGGWGRAPASSAGSPVAVHPVQGRQVRVPAMRPWSRPRTAWPAAGSGTAVLAAGAVPGGSGLRAGPSAGSGRAGTLPVWVGPPDNRSLVTSASVSRDAAARVRVNMASQAAAGALGVHGVVFSVARSDGSLAASRVHVSLDYSSFAQAAGGGYASRLRLVELPACALTSPQLARCRTQAPARSADDVRVARLGADVTLPGAGASAASSVTTLMSAASPTPLVLAAVSSPAGSGGNFAAEPFSEAGDWVTGGSSGAFTYSYPIAVPPVPGGLQPDVSLKYDSQAVDGLTSATNNQASWIGDGWDYSPGFIEIDYATCATELTEPATGDLCPEVQQMTLSRDGTATPLVVGSGGVYKAEADGGEKVMNLGNSWEIIEPDGTQYYFGLSQLPGYVSGDPVTNSVWTVPVRSGTGFTAKPWRYMLDYVVDPHGNAIAYFYNTQTNYYAEDNGTTGTGAYTQGGMLAKIEYGLRDGSAYGTTPAAQVTFTAGSRVRADAPADLACAQGAACTVTSPTFWTSYPLTGISTQALAGGSLQNVDSWALAGSYPDTGDPTTSPSLWLSSVTRAGQDGGTAITLPPVSFAGTPMPNRVQTAADTSAGYSAMTRFRLTGITNQTGGVTTVSYSPAGAGSCAATGSFPAPDSNTASCYPGYWYTGLPSSLTQAQDWFSLYSVAKVTDTDTTGGDPPVVTSFGYSGPAWHYDDDTISRSATATWDQWRGFGTVTTQTGTAPDPVTQTTGTYFQGMDGDKTSTAVSSVTLTSTHGDKIRDSDQYAGMAFETIVYNGAGTGNEVADTITLPYTSPPTAINTALGQAAYIADTSSVDTYTVLAGGGTRESIKAYTYDSNGQIATDSEVPDTSNPAEDTCTTTTYVANTSAWILDLPSEVNVVALPCGTLATQPSQVISDTKYSYDGGGAGTPTAGNLTQVQRATAVSQLLSTLTYTYTTTQTSTYDQYGRMLTSTDADNRKTITAYTPAGGAEPVSVQVTDPAGLVTTTSYDPARDLATGVTDPAGYQSAEAYDALGRVTAKWTPGNPTSGPAVEKYNYTVSNSAPSVATKQVLEPGGGYLTSQTLDDSLGQVRETQAQTAGGGTDVADVSYNSDGWKALVSDPYFTSGAPSGTLVTAAPGTVPSQTGYAYDSAGRETRQVAYALGTETWETDTGYGGNYVTVVPPSGGTSQTTFTDGRGLTTAIYQYHAGVPASPSDPAADYDQTSYGYTAAKQLSSITDATGNTWSWTYDLLGNQLTATDPDSGETTSTYDAASQLITVTDARGKQVSYAYDGDGRKTAKYDTTGGALETTSDQLASWTWDTLAKGRLTSSTTFWGGASYTQAVTGYNPLGLPSGTQTLIPAAQGALAGTYTQQDSYAPDGQLTSYTDDAAGGLPAETVTTGYDAAGEPTSLGGAATYVDSLSYTNLGEPQQYTIGTSAQPVYITDSYDPQTRRLAEQDTQAGTAMTSVDDLHYTYDHAGNVTSEADTPSGDGGVTDVQCFQYDYMGRLAQAWAQGSTGCASTPSASAEGGAAPYWDSYSYNAVGNLTGITATTPAGAVTSTTDSYPAAGAARPHAISSAKVTSASGTNSTSYGYDASGHLTTAARPAQSQALTWDDAGQLTQDAVTPAGGSAKNTSYVYDAADTLLLAADPGTITLYLPDEELSLNTATGTVTGTRYYSVDGTAVAARTGVSGLAYLAGDTQGTASVAIDAATGALTRRYYDPYGNPRGTAPASFPAGQKGFTGGTADAATGLTNLGAREYQPGTGSFISPDPLLNPYDPQDLNAYAYAKDNPATLSDPNGACAGPDGMCQYSRQTYHGAHGCTGASQQAVHACEQSYEADHRADKPKGRKKTSVVVLGAYQITASPQQLQQAIQAAYGKLGLGNAYKEYCHGASSCVVPGWLAMNLEQDLGRQVCAQHAHWCAGAKWIAAPNFGILSAAGIWAFRQKYGAMAEAASARYIQKTEGNSIIGTNVTFRLPSGKTADVDILYLNPETAAYKAVQVKYFGARAAWEPGEARRVQRQMDNLAELRSKGGTIISYKRALEDIEGWTMEAGQIEVEYDIWEGVEGGPGGAGGGEGEEP